MANKIYKKTSWMHSTGIYEVNLRQYTAEGTFNTFANSLPRLKDMGVETLWFMPITPISQKNRKGSLGSYYACSDYLNINTEFGTLNDFKKLVELAHSMGFKILIDWVANHTGWDHVWTTQHPEYYLKDAITNDFKTPGGMEDIIELDHKNPALRDAMIAAMKFWITECDIDGFRCDLAFWVDLQFWIEARTILEKTKTLFWFGEFDPIVHQEYYECFDAAYTWTWMHKTEEFYKKTAGLDLLKNVLGQYENACGKKNIPTWFTSNHDENSWNGTEYEKYGDMAKALAVFSFTWNGLPLLYSGQELPNTKRLAFFDKDIIEWDKKNELHNFYKTLFSLKKNNPALKAGDENAITRLLKTDADENMLSFIRKNGENEVLVFLNMSKSTTGFKLIDKEINGKYTSVFGKTDLTISANQFFEMKPWDYLLFEKINSQS